METPAATRRRFTRGCLLALVAGLGAPAARHGACGQPPPSASGATRRDVIKQRLPGEPPRDLLLIEVTYPPGTGSPVHLHANGVLAFVVSGAIVSQVDDGPEHTYHAGEAWWEPPGAVHRVSRNAHTAEAATLLAIYIAPAGATGMDLMQPL
jgi:quercetin dioxygenase-like cupin family protein